MTQHLTDTQVTDLLNSEKQWNVVRRVFSRHAALIEAAAAQRPLAVMELRRMEFEAVADIARCFGTLFVVEGEPRAAGKSPWEKPTPPEPGRSGS
jgi:hypothetical protein